MSVKIYCGSKSALPSGYGRFGTRYECMQCGYGSAMMQYKWSPASNSPKPPNRNRKGCYRPRSSPRRRPRSSPRSSTRRSPRRRKSKSRSKRKKRSSPRRRKSKSRSKRKKRSSPRRKRSSPSRRQINKWIREEIKKVRKKSRR